MFFRHKWLWISWGKPASEELECSYLSDVELVSANQNVEDTLKVRDSKNVIVFDPLLVGHVIRRMRSGRVRIFNGNQWETL